MEKDMIQVEQGPRGVQGPQGPSGPALALASFLTTVGVLLAFKVAEAFFSTGHTVFKQATKNIEKKLQ